MERRNVLTFAVGVLMIVVAIVAIVFLSQLGTSVGF
jgi:hypothetical protein